MSAAHEDHDAHDEPPVADVLHEAGAHVEKVDGHGQAAANSGGGLSEKERERYSTEMQAELARMEGSARGNVMEVHAENLEIMEVVLRTRQDIAATLGAEIDKYNLNNQAGAQFVLNTLVTDQLASEIEHVQRAILVAKRGGLEVSEAEVAKATAKFMNGGLSLRPSGREGLRRGGRMAIADRIRELEDPMIAPTENEVVELAQLHKLHDAWEEAEQNIRGEILSTKRTDATFIDGTFGFIAGDADAEQAFVENAALNLPGLDTEHNRRVLVTYLNNPIAKQALMGDPARFDTWLRTVLPNPHELLLRQIYNSELLRTQRSLNTVLSYDNVSRWRESPQTRVLMSLLSDRTYRAIFNGDGPVEGVNIDGGVIGSFDEHRHLNHERHEVQHELNAINHRLNDPDARWPQPPLFPLTIDERLSFLRDEIHRLGGGSSEYFKEEQKKVEAKVAELRAKLAATVRAMETYNRLTQESRDVNAQILLIQRAAAPRAGATSARTGPDVREREARLTAIKNKQDSLRDQIGESYILVTDLRRLCPSAGFPVILNANFDDRSNVYLDPAADESALEDVLGRGQGAADSYAAQARNADSGNAVELQSHRTELASLESEKAGFIAKRDALLTKRGEIDKHLAEHHIDHAPHFQSPEHTVQRLLEIRAKVDWAQKNGRRSINDVPHDAAATIAKDAAGRAEVMFESAEGGSDRVAGKLEIALQNRPATFAQKIRRAKAKTMDFLFNYDIAPALKTVNEKGGAIITKGVNKVVSAPKAVGVGAFKLFKRIITTNPHGVVHASAAGGHGH